MSKIDIISGFLGAGKTTLLSLITGLENCTEGQILYDGKDLKKMNLDTYRNTDIGNTSRDNTELALRFSLLNLVENDKMLNIPLYLMWNTIKYIDKKYARKVKNPRLGGMICIEKFYNKGATLNLLAKHPKVMTAIHSVIMVFVAVVYYFAMRMTGKELTKTGLAMLAGGGLSNLYDRYTKHHVVDYVRFQTGPKWFRRIIFNVSDFFIFIGAVLAVIGSER